MAEGGLEQVGGGSAYLWWRGQPGEGDETGAMMRPTGQMGQGWRRQEAERDGGS